MDFQQMYIRKGRVNDFDKLEWFWTNLHKQTMKIFINRINKGIQEFWVVEYKDCLIGELHIVWNSEDEDEANGLNRAYILAYRIHPNYQGNGVGSKLMKKVLSRIKDNNFNEATIGVETKESHIYYKWGFKELIKTKEIDHHGFTSNEQYKRVAPYNLYLYKLG